jgi:hypothetical protein
MDKAECGRQAYRIVRDTYKKQCLQHAKTLYQLVYEQISPKECGSLVYKQLKPYRKQYSLNLAKQLFSLSERNAPESERQALITQYLKKPVLTIAYQDTPEYQSWAEENLELAQRFSDEEPLPVSTVGNTPAGVSNPDAAEGEPPNAFTCPFSFDVMDNPMVLSDGRSYDLPMVETLFQQSNPRNPITGTPLDRHIQIENKLLKRLIDIYKQRGGIDDSLLKNPNGRFFVNPYINQDGETYDLANGFH